MKKIFLAAIAIALLAISCNGEKIQVGVVKTANGGVDWQSANKIKDEEKSLLDMSITKLRFNPSADKVYASSLEGGLFSSEDAGENWKEVLGSVAIYDFAFHPNNGDIIYAASYLSERGRVLKTTDGGKSWTEVYSDAGTKNPVRAIAVNPDNPSELLIGMGKGDLIRSTDEGQNWRLVQGYNDRINNLVWEPGNLYIVVHETGVFHSTDGGDSSRQITRGLARTINRSQISIFSSGSIREYVQFAVSKQNPGHLFLTTNRGLHESMDGGNSWKHVSMPFRAQDARTFALAVAQESDSVIYVGADSVIFKTADGGQTWTSSDTRTNGLVTSILISPDQSLLVFAGVSR